MHNPQHYINELSKNHVHFTLLSNGNLVIWTSGYKTRECYDLEAFMMKGGFYALKMDFDTLCGKTRTEYVFPKKTAK